MNNSKLKIYQVIPEMYPRMVQYSNGKYYDGSGNLLTSIVQYSNGKYYDGTGNSLNSVILDYTPSGPSDVYGFPGFTTKDDENIYVRTTNLGWRQIPFNNSYGNFYDTTIQTNPTASTPRKMRFNSTAESKYVSVTNGDVYVDYDGLYNIQFSAQLDKTDSGADDVDIWLRYNGVDIPWSNTRVTLIGNNAKQVAAWNFYQAMTASSYFNIMWSSADVDVRIYGQGTQSGPTRPAIPSVILTVDKISSL
jgi:hypothetical protein